MCIVTASFVARVGDFKISIGCIFLTVGDKVDY